MAEKAKRGVGRVKAEPKRPRNAKTRYAQSEIFEKGVVVKDTLSTSWMIDAPIGQGGFGAIYSTQKVGNSPSSSRSKLAANYAIKLEPHENGPLFTEVNFFIRFLKSNIITEWKRKHNLTFLGVPEYCGNGSHTHKNVKHRFLVMPKFEGNINDKIYSTGKTINFARFKVFLQQIVDALHFIHDQGYFHGDIKPENLLLGSNSKKDEVYLVDYGLAHLCYKDKIMKADKNKQHNGTLLFCPRDSHFGLGGTKRSDFEILGYNLLSWLDYELPWKNDTEPDVIYKKKEDFMNDLKSSLRNTEIPKQIIEFLEYVKNLSHLDAPDYNRIKKLFDSIDDKESSGSEGTSNRKVRKPIVKNTDPITVNGIASTSADVEESEGISNRRGRKPVVKNTDPVTGDGIASTSADVEDTSPAKRRPRARKQIVKNNDPVNGISSSASSVEDTSSPKPRGRKPGVKKNIDPNVEKLPVKYKGRTAAMKTVKPDEVLKTRLTRKRIILSKTVESSSGDAGKGTKTVARSKKAAAGNSNISNKKMKLADDK